MCIVFKNPFLVQLGSIIVKAYLEFEKTMQICYT